MLRAGYCITRPLPSKLLAHYSVHHTSPYRSKTPQSIRIRSGRTGGQRTLPQLNEGRGVPSSAFAYPSSPPPLLPSSPLPLDGILHMHSNTTFTFCSIPKKQNTATHVMLEWRVRSSIGCLWLHA